MTFIPSTSSCDGPIVAGTDSCNIWWNPSASSLITFAGMIPGRSHRSPQPDHGHRRPAFRLEDLNCAAPQHLAAGPHAGHDGAHRRHRPGAGGDRPRRGCGWRASSAGRSSGWPARDPDLPPLTRALTALGPAYIKFGQVLSTRPDIVGEDVRPVEIPADKRRPSPPQSPRPWSRPSCR